MGRLRKKRKKRKQQKQQKQGQEKKHKQPGPKIRVASLTTCPLCRDPVGAASDGLASVSCGGCSVTYHQECVEELGGCATLGCPQRGRLPGSSTGEAPLRVVARRRRERGAREAPPQGSVESNLLSAAIYGVTLAAPVALAAFLYKGIWATTSVFDLPGGLRAGALAGGGAWALAAIYGFFKFERTIRTRVQDWTE